MATYDLNQVLKDREKKLKQAGKQGGEDQPMDLGDVSRVKVLSPGRQVFKRFIRNRLAVFGTVTLIIMFVFSFIGPLFYAYGQKQIFYTFDRQNVNYALAKENTAYNGYDVSSDEGGAVQVERSVVNAMNSNIKKMQQDGRKEMTIPGKEGSYIIREEAEHIYTLSTVDLQSVCSVGDSTVKVGTWSMIGKEFTFDGEEIEGLAEEAGKSIKGVNGTFTFDGQDYTWDKGAKPKTFDVFTVMNGLVYEDAELEEELGADFEEALNAALDAGESAFTFGDDSFTVIAQSNRADVYKAGEEATQKVYTSYTVDTFETGASVSNEFRANALMAVTADGTFEADGSSYTIEPDENGLMVKDKDGNEFAEFGLFSVRRYSGEDTMAYDLKKAVAAKVESMLENDEKSGTLTAQIPMQEADGSYATEADGSYKMADTEMKITQRLEGEYVINCEQINYIIDIFAKPSAKHVLGTDSDGFDVLARVMYGGRISLMVGFIVVIIETVLGVIMGGLAGYFGGWVDNLIMRLVDIFYCLPSLPIMIILGAMMDAIRMDTYKRLMIMMAVLGLMGWAGVARLVRGQILSLREQEFMVATEATGIRIKDRIFRHLVPNVMPQLIVTATMGLGSVILTESTLSYLGLGVKHPLATWGTIINSVSSASAMAHYAFIWIPVGLLICFTVIAFNFVGDGLRDAYDPKSKR